MNGKNVDCDDLVEINQNLIDLLHQVVVISFRHNMRMLQMLHQNTIFCLSRAKIQEGLPQSQLLHLKMRLFLVL